MPSSARQGRGRPLPVEGQGEEGSRVERIQGSRADGREERASLAGAESSPSVALPFGGVGGAAQASGAAGARTDSGRPPRPQRAVPTARAAAVMAAVERRPLLRRQLQWLIAIRLIVVTAVFVLYFLISLLPEEPLPALQPRFVFLLLGLAFGFSL